MTLLSEILCKQCPAVRSVPAAPTYFTKVMNSSSMQVLWELPSKAGKAEGFRLSYRRVPHGDFQAPIQLSCHTNAHTFSNLGKGGALWLLQQSHLYTAAGVRLVTLIVSEHGAVYEVKLVAYNGNGESDCAKRLVSLAEEGLIEQSTGDSLAAV